MPKSNIHAKGRRNVPLYVMLPPEEHARLVAFAASIDRPLSWAVRDALRVYLDAVEGDAAKLADLRAAVATPEVDLGKAGKTKQPRRGRPPNRDYGRVEPKGKG